MDDPKIAYISQLGRSEGKDEGCSFAAAAICQVIFWQTASAQDPTMQVMARNIDDGSSELVSGNAFGYEGK
jgi:hypothetical protein